jgi:hypothetical protein
MCGASIPVQVRLARGSPVVALFATISVLVACASGPQSPESVNQDEVRHVLAAEDEYVVAEVARDEPTLRRLVDARFVRVLGNGTTYGKEELIQGILKLRMSKQSLRERSALVESNFAVVIGTADIWFAQAEGPDKLSTLRYSSTYIKREGQWRMLSLHLAQRT